MLRASHRRVAQDASPYERRGGRDCARLARRGTAGHPQLPACAPHVQPAQGEQEKAKGASEGERTSDEPRAIWCAAVLGLVIVYSARNGDTIGEFFAMVTDDEVREA